jgi:Fur family ferric uptake transcriptional regulator
MKHLHTEEKEQFRNLSEQEKIDHIEDRFKILDVFLQSEDHITIDQLMAKLAQNDLHFSPDLVKDTLRLLCDFGFAHRNRFENGEVRYEHRHLGLHHDHLVCTRCKNIVEFTDPDLEKRQLAIAAAHGFLMMQHRMEIYGICARCLQERAGRISLDAAKPGERLVIADLKGGAAARMRLLTMGLRVGDTVDVITNIGSGQVVVSADCRRYVIGRGMAQKIVAAPIGSAVDLPDTSDLEPHQPLPMSQMRQGQAATIVRVGGSGPLRRRILEMGLVKGAEIYVEKYAPLQDPLELIVKGYHISLRVEEAAQIMVDHVR